jgi:four helix bundle protein
MFLELAHTKLDVFKASHEFVLESYKATKLLPQEEKFAMAQQIRRVTLSVHLNFAEGCTRKSFAERKRFYEVARGSLVEVDTAFDIAHSLNYFTREDTSTLGERLTKTFKILSGMIKGE